MSAKLREADVEQDLWTQRRRGGSEPRETPIHMYCQV